LKVWRRRIFVSGDDIRGQRNYTFWDVDPKTIDPEKHAKYIIERVMDFGNDQEARWIYKRYPRCLPDQYPLPLTRNPVTVTGNLFLEKYLQMC